jgi:ligand-binding sensor domain-containing protein/putative methionine-R-sulfoxide reductase with GAF domain
MDEVMKRQLNLNSVALRKPIFILTLKKIIPLLLLIVCLSGHLYAQKVRYIFKHLTTSDGLLSNKLTCLYEDDDGFMWIGFQTGLQRFDGYHFKNYFADVRDTAALQSDWVSAIFEDSKKRFWVANDQDGVYILNRTTGEFYNYNQHAKAANKIHGVRYLTEDKQGAIWVIGQSGFYKLNEITNQFENYTGFLGLDKTSNGGTLVFDSENNIWFNTVTGIKFYNQKEKRLYSDSYNPTNNPLFKIKNLGGNIILSKNNLWFSGYKIFYKYNLLTKAIKTFEVDKLPSKNIGLAIQKESVGGLFALQDGAVIIGLIDRGLAISYPNKDKLELINTDNTKTTSYHSIESDGSYTSLTEGRNKNILVGSSAGINIFNTEKLFFTVHQYEERSKNLFPKEAANDFLEMPNGDIYIGYYDWNSGIVKADSNFQFKKKFLYSIHGIDKNITSNQIWNLFNDGKGTIWAPNQARSILKINIQNEKITEEKNDILNGPINMIKQDAEGNIWMGHWSKGLVKKDGITNTYKFYTEFVHINSTIKKRVQCILLDGNKIWAGTLQDGLQLFDKSKEKFVEGFVADEKNKTSISNNCVNDIIRYNEDTLVIATLMGLNIFNERTKTFKTITTKDGLPNNLIQSIINDGLGYIWVAFFSGDLCRINMSDFSIITYGINDGITGNDFSSRFYKLRNGNILLGASKSFISFNPLSFTSSVKPNNVCITGLHVFEEDIMLNSTKFSNDRLSLSYKENSLRIEFASLEYWNPEGTKYYYKLNGIDKDWVLADKSLTAIYNQLNDGNYLFEVKCANRDGIFCNNITTLKIYIKPPFWKTWWFILLSILSAFFATFSIVRWREKNIKSIEAEKLKVQELNAAQYKSKLELEQIINYFSSSLIDKNTVDAVLWDVAKNLIGQLGFVDCMIYLWNEDKTKMVQRAGHGPKDTAEKINAKAFDVAVGQGVVGYVMQTKEAVLIGDTSKDIRYRPDDIVRLSEITVPIIYENELIGVIDSEHPEKNFYTEKHLQILTTIEALVGNKIKSIEAEENLQTSKIAIYKMEVLLAKAKLESLRSQMNPHFIFNSLNAIQECIVTGNVDAAYEYLSKFSKLQRLVLNNSAKELIPLGTEVEMLQLYLSLESLRFSKSFSYKIDIDKKIDKEEILIPSLITQPYVENSIWHGLRNMENEKRLTVYFKENHENLIIIIDDNGIGRAEAGEIKAAKIGVTKYASKGSIISADRIELLNQQYKTTITLHYTDKKDKDGNAIGTTVTINLPNNLSMT